MTQFSRKGQLVIIILAAAILFSGGYQYSQMRSNRPSQEILIPGGQDVISSNETNEIVVHVAGEVENPGIYSLSEGARVIDAINKAIITGNADINQLNLASCLRDEQKIYVPPKRNADDSWDHISTANGTNSRTVNINMAPSSELESLPGIGPVLAERIVQYRQKNGPFASPEDLLNVSGIGDARFGEIKDLVSIY